MATVSAAAFALSSTRADAGHGSDLPSYAHRVDSIAHELEDEFRLHFKHLGAYRHLRSDVSQVIAKAHHIDRLSHDPHSSLTHISNDLRELDRLAHHMHEVVDAAERGRYGGHAHGDNRHVHSLLDSLNGAIHTMQRSVERMRSSCHGDFGGHSYHGASRYGHGRPWGIRYGSSHGSRGYSSRAELAAGTLRFAFSRYGH